MKIGEEEFKSSCSARPRINTCYFRDIVPQSRVFSYILLVEGEVLPDHLLSW